MAAQGKIARLPHRLRLLLNERLRDGQAASTILPWLNSQPETAAMLEALGSETAISEANLSNYRLGEYKTWLDRQDVIQQTRDLHDMARDLASAGGEGMAEGLIAVFLGRLVSAMNDDDSDPETLTRLIKDFPKLSNEEIKHKRLALARDQLTAKSEERRLKAEALAQSRDKLEKQTVEKFWEWHSNPEIQALLEKPKSNANMGQLRQLLFGDRTKRAAAAASAKK